MNVPPTRPGCGPIGSLSRGVARRWPALAVATLAVAIPASVALADTLGSTTILATAQEIALTVGANNNGFVVDVSNGGVFGEGIRVSSATNAIEANAGLGTPNGTAIKATGGSEGVVAQGGNTSNLGRGVEGLGVGVAAGGEHVGVNAVGGDTGVVAEGTTGVVADGVTGVSASGATGPGIKASSINGPGVQATSTNSIAVVGEADSQFGIGVDGASNGADGVGVQGQGIGIGVSGISPDGDAVAASSTGNGTGVESNSAHGLGGEFTGGRAPLRLVPAKTVGAPTSGTHQRGELYVDSRGQLFLCVADSTGGNPGTWKQVVLK